MRSRTNWRFISSPRATRKMLTLVVAGICELWRGDDANRIRYDFDQRYSEPGSVVHKNTSARSRKANT